VLQAGAVGATVGFLAALLAGLLVSRRVVRPIQEMMRASQHISEGHYDERVELMGNAARDELDELDQLALSFNRMASKLEQTEAMRRDLIGNMAHELRTPLTSIKGYMEGLTDGVVPADAAAFQLVHREADRLQRLVADLEELSKVEARTVSLHRRPTLVSRLLEGVVGRLGRQYEDKGVSLDTDAPDDLPMVLADEDRVGQVLLNLAGNALQYTPAGGRVVLSARRDGRMVRFAVEDTGIGISAEHLPHLFERFYRVDRSRSRTGGGSGLGLTIAKHLVEAHGGEIAAHSAGTGHGSTFTFTLPVA